MNKGLFITFEGPDGSGKTSVCQKVYELLKNKGYDVIRTREPGGIEIAEKIRSIILDKNNTKMSYKTEALLYAASRAQHLDEKVKPLLNDGKIVICERFVDSSLAYQGIGRELGFEKVYQLNLFATEGLMPDLTIFLDVSEEIGLQRIQGRSEKDRLDKEGLAFHHRVSQGYEMVKEHFKDRISLVDASKSFEEVVDDSYLILKEYIDAKRKTS